MTKRAAKTVRKYDTGKKLRKALARRLDRRNAYGKTDARWQAAHKHVPGSMKR